MVECSEEPHSHKSIWHRSNPPQAADAREGDEAEHAADVQGGIVGVVRIRHGSASVWTSPAAREGLNVAAKQPGH